MTTTEQALSGLPVMAMAGGSADRISSRVATPRTPFPSARFSPGPRDAVSLNGAKGDSPSAVRAWGAQIECARKVMYGWHRKG